MLEECHISRKALPTDGILPTKLHCTNRNVDEENDSKLRELPGIATAFMSTDDFKGVYDGDLKRNIAMIMDKKVPSIIHLKVGAQVILTRNMPDFNLVNGSRGIIFSFDEGTDHEGQIKSGSRSDTKYCPVVHFSNGVRMIVREESVFHGGPSGAMTRRQLPLKLAWSLTVHKSQGMTIERAELQLDDAFDYGQVYVALSRITSLDGLWVRGGRITQSVVKAHPKVEAFYQQNGSSLYKVQSTKEHSSIC
jgi:ATP-dependent DNA helicase PIF1